LPKQSISRILFPSPFKNNYSQRVRDMTIYLSVKTSSNSRAEIVAFGPLHLHQTRLATDVHRCTNACALTVPTILRCRNPVSFSGIGTRFHPYPDKSGRFIFCCAFLEPLGPLIFMSVFALWCSDFPLLTLNVTNQAFSLTLQRILRISLAAFLFARPGSALYTPRNRAASMAETFL